MRVVIDSPFCSLSLPLIADIANAERMDDARHGERCLQIEVQGDLPAILTIAVEHKKPADGAGGVQVEVVAIGRTSGSPTRRSI